MWGREREGEREREGWRVSEPPRSLIPLCSPQSNSIKIISFYMEPPAVRCLQGTFDLLQCAACLGTTPRCSI